MFYLQFQLEMKKGTRINHIIIHGTVNFNRLKKLKKADMQVKWTFTNHLSKYGNICFISTSLCLSMCCFSLHKLRVEHTCVYHKCIYETSLGDNNIWYHLCDISSWRQKHITPSFDFPMVNGMLTLELRKIRHADKSGNLRQSYDNKKLIAELDLKKLQLH